MAPVARGRADLGLPGGIPRLSAVPDLLRRGVGRGGPAHAGQFPRVLHRSLLPALALELPRPRARDGRDVLRARPRRRLPARALRLPGPEPVQLSHPDPDHLPAARGRARLHLHPRAGGHRQRPPDGHLRHDPADQLPVRPPRGGAGGDASSLPDDHAQRRRRPRQDRPLARGGRVERRGPALADVLDGDLAAHHAGVRRGGAPRLHLDLLGLRHAADPGCPGSARRPGLPQYRPVRGSAHLPHGHRDLRPDGAAGGALPARRAALRRPQGLLVALLLADRAAAAVRCRPGARRRRASPS